MTAASTNNALPRKQAFAIWLVYLNIALYATCYQLQRPVEPFLIEKLSKSAGLGRDSFDEYARLQSFFSVMQMVGSIFVGGLLDMLGPKTMFMVNFAASALSYYLLSQATTMDILYYSKLPTVLQAGYLCAQTVFAQITSDGEERVTTLGRLAVAYTVGMVAGPLIGGYLGSQGDYYFGARLACYGSVLSCVLTMLLPSESKKGAATAASAPAAAEGSSSQSAKSVPPRGSWELLKASFFAVGGLLGTKVISSIANSMRETTFPLVLKDAFRFDEKAMGTAMSCLSALNAIINGFLLGPVTRLFGGDLLPVLHSCLVALVGLCLSQAAILQAWTPPRAAPQPAPLWASSPSALWTYLATTICLSICAYILSTTATSESTSRVPMSMRGKLLGTEHSLFAAARVGAPSMGVALLKDWGPSGVAVAAAAVFASVVLAWRGVQGLPGQPFGRKAASRLLSLGDEGGNSSSVNSSGNSSIADAKGTSGNGEADERKEK